MAEKSFIVEVEPGLPAVGGHPSKGPVYRNVLANNGFPLPPRQMETCWDVFRISVEKLPDNPMLGQREVVDEKAGKYVWRSYKEVYDIVIKLGNSLRSCGVGKGARCGIYGANCPEWIMSMEACNAHGISCVPFYDTLGAGAVEFIILHAEVSVAFVEEKKISELLKTLPKTAHYLKTLISFGEITLEHKEEVSKHDVTIYAWNEFLDLAKGKEYELPVKDKADICTIMYTSGTTGDPKGVLLSNENIVNLIAGLDCYLDSVNATFTFEDVYMSYLPLAHIFDRMVEECIISHGGQIGFWRRDVRLLVEDMMELKPTILCAVPRVLERVYAGMNAKVNAGSKWKRAIFNVVYNYKLERMKKGIKHEEASPVLDKIVFSKFKEILGGRTRLMISGGAPLATHIETFLRVVTCCHVVQGYGLTETCAATFIAVPNELDMLGTVGPPVPNVDVRLESVPEMNYDALSSKPSGEICLRGKTIFQGYHKRQDLTNEVLIDGWFHTGDIGEWQPNGSLRVINRKKNIFKLSQGEYVVVENLENIYVNCSSVDSIWVYGSSFKSFLVAVVNPNKQVLEQWAQENGVNGDFKSLCDNTRTKEFIVQELAKIAKEKKLIGFEFIKAVYLDYEPFSIERGLLTPKYGFKRPGMLKYYEKAIDEMYETVNKF